MKVRPGQLARALGITTDALAKQRKRDTSPYEYEVIEGRVFYDMTTLPPSVRENIEKLTTTKTKQSHYDIKDPRYWNSIGKRNEQRIRNKQQRIEAVVQERLAEERRRRSSAQEPRQKKVYASWVNPYTHGNYWKSIEDYENSKKKKTVKPFY